jgi:PAS domain S-box-containing protein
MYKEIINRLEAFIIVTDGLGNVVEVNNFVRNKFNIPVSEASFLNLSNILPLNFSDQIYSLVFGSKQTDWSFHDIKHNTVTGEEIRIDWRIVRFDINNSTHFAFYGTDTTRFSKLNIDLQSQKAYLHEIVDNSDYFSWIVDLNNKYVLVNEPFARFFNMKSEDLVGHDCLNFLTPEQDAEIASIDRMVIQNKREHSFQGEAFVHGKLYCFEASKKPIFNSNGDVIATMGIARDITQKK